MERGRGRDGRRRRALLAPLLAVLWLPDMAAAQTFTGNAPSPNDEYPTGVPASALPISEPETHPRAEGLRLPSPVLTVDWEKLFDSTQWGQRIRSDLERATAAQRAENDRIADELIAEEKALTEKRGKIDTATFQQEADAFDAKATRIRTTQNAKAQALTQRFDAMRSAFFDRVAPLLDEVLRRRGAVVVIDQRAVIRALPEADATPDLISLIDTRYGDGPADAEAVHPGSAGDDKAPVANDDRGQPVFPAPGSTSGPVTGPVTGPATDAPPETSAPQAAPHSGSAAGP